MASPLTTILPYTPPTKKQAVIEPDPKPQAAVGGSAEAQAQAANLSTVHSAFATKFAADKAAADKAASSNPATYQGFGVSEISQFFGGLSPTSTVDLISKANSGQAVDALYQAGLQHLADHPKGSHYSGDFNVTNNIIRGVTAFGTGTYSEFARDKPFQPGQEKQDTSVTGALTGYGGAAVQGSKKLLATPGPPPLAAAPPPTPDQAATRQALDKADLERRRQLSSGAGPSSALGLPGDANVKRSVLG